MYIYIYIYIYTYIYDPPVGPRGLGPEGTQGVLRNGGRNSCIEGMAHYK